MNTCELPYVRQLIPKDVIRDERARIYRGSRKVSLDPIKAADLQYQPVLLQSSMERDMDNIKRAPLYIIPSTTTRVGALTRPAPPQAKWAVVYHDARPGQISSEDPSRFACALRVLTKPMEVESLGERIAKPEGGAPWG